MAVLFENFDQMSSSDQFLILRKQAHKVLQNIMDDPMLITMMNSNSGSWRLSSKGEGASASCIVEKTTEGTTLKRVVHFKGKLAYISEKFYTLGYKVGGVNCPIAFALLSAFGSMGFDNKHSLILTLSFYSEYTKETQIKSQEYTYILHPSRYIRQEGDKTSPFDRILDQLVHFYACILFDFKNTDTLHNLTLGNDIGSDLYEFAITASR